MPQQILFIQGGGKTGYQADAALADSLSQILGNDYHVMYPEINPDEAAPDFGWLEQLAANIRTAGENSIIAAHSFGASMLLKCLSENTAAATIKGIFCIATPFWEGNEDWEKPLQLADHFADKLPAGVPLYFYHCKDDVEIPFSHFEHYKAAVPQAMFRAFSRGGHQFNNDLSLVAKDIILLLQ